jgi:hypothetical protein
MQKRRTIEDVVKEIAAALKQLEIEYVIVGGIAATSWGNIRTTLDIDVIMNIKEDDAPALVSALRKRGFSLDQDDVIMALREKSHFTAFDDRSLVRIDAKGAYGPRELESMRTKRKIIVDKTECYLASPEDMIANKLLSGSEQDLRDAEGIYARQIQHLDMDALKNIVKKLGVSTELNKMERRVGKRIADLSSEDRK